MKLLILQEVYSTALVALTDSLLLLIQPPSPLRIWAEENAIAVHPSDPFVPGRYSSLSTLGLLPLKVLGYELQQIRIAYHEFIEYISYSESSISLQANQTAALLAVLASEPGSRLVLSAGLNLLPVLQWTEQIVSESLGKSGFGVLPVVEPHLTDDLPSDRVQVRIQVAESEQVSIIDEQLNDSRQVVPVFSSLADCDFHDWIPSRNEPI